MRTTESPVKKTISSEVVRPIYAQTYPEQTAFLLVSLSSVIIHLSDLSLRNPKTAVIGRGTHLDSLFFILVLLNHVDCLLHVAEYQVAVTIVSLIA